MAGLQADFSLRRSASFRLDLQLAIPPGKTVALLGPNGAGKSTAVSALAGLLAIDRGSIVLNGTTLDDPARGQFVFPEARRVGVVFQDYLLFPHLSALENVAFGLRSRGVPRATALARARQWLERVELSDLADRKPTQLSGGQGQRVALARALITEPDLLLLDEPLSALDVTTRAQLRRGLAAHLREYSGPRLLITHDPTEAFLLADEVHVIEGGRITQSGTADQIRLSPRTDYAASLAGSNLVTGHAAGGSIDTGTHILHIADRQIEGPVLATIPPSVVSIHRARPEGSPRNSWQTPIELIEPLGDRVRLRIGQPLPLTVEITQPAFEELGLSPGLPVWVSIKATEIGVEPGG
jgi:molybdate transport system ATP-binding protein